jgi:hypothetical protein
MCLRVVEGLCKYPAAVSSINIARKRMFSRIQAVVMA